MESTFTPMLVSAVISILSVSDPGLGVLKDPDQALHDWQVRRLMQPLPHEREKERNGGIYIYDSLTELEVDTALDSNFDRIQNMMFMGTLKTDASGQPMLDASTGQVVQESGGCSGSE